MVGFENFWCVRVILSGIEVMHMIRKGQIQDNGSPKSAAQQFYSLVIVRVP
ncbi:integrase catalytic region [Caballeronia choica]|jgi:hypothetical protein|uniref:Integrase catalytic region n=1 Tax=Caballeronia choica TaxID=326476 RepID=A0A158KMH2_9BURK|nr:integrase catalytic region [Caballeronia choica]